MPLYRKKPLTIEARLFDPSKDYDHACDVVKWCGGELSGTTLYIDTLEGMMNARPGDYVIRGVQSEFYPCKPEIFHATYEPVDG